MRFLISIVAQIFLFASVGCYNALRIQVISVGRFLITNRHRKRDARATARCSILDPNAATVSFDYTFGDCQPHSNSTRATRGCSIARGSIESFEDPLAQV